MAQKVQVTLIDDIDGTSVATATRTFAVDGVNYEIDLTDENQSEFDKAIEKYVGAARKVAGTGRKAAGASRASASGGARPAAQAPRKRSSAEVKKMREWGAENGFTVADRGRLPAGLEDAYDKAHPAG